MLRRKGRRRSEDKWKELKDRLIKKGEVRIDGERRGDHGEEENKERGLQTQGKREGKRERGERRERERERERERGGEIGHQAVLHLPNPFLPSPPLTSHL